MRRVAVAATTPTPIGVQAQQTEGEQTPATVSASCHHAKQPTLVPLAGTPLPVTYNQQKHQVKDSQRRNTNHDHYNHDQYTSTTSSPRTHRCVARHINTATLACYTAKVSSKQQQTKRTAVHQLLTLPYTTSGSKCPNICTCSNSTFCLAASQAPFSKPLLQEERCQERTRQNIQQLSTHMHSACAVCIHHRQHHSLTKKKQKHRKCCAAASVHGGSAALSCTTLPT